MRKWSFLSIFLLCPFLTWGQLDTTAIAKGNELLEQSYSYIVDSADYYKAIEVSEEARDIFIEVLGPYDTLVAEAYLNIAEGYFSLEKFDKSIEYFLKEGNVYKQLDNLTPTLLASNFNNLGLCHEFKGDYERAFSFYEQSIPIFKNSKHKNAAKNLAFTYNNVAICHNRTQNYHRALQYLEKTLQAEKAIFKEDNLDIASTYTNIGLTHKLMGDYENALELLHKALDLRLKLQDKSVYRMARLYGSIGLCYLAMKDYDNALENCERDLNLKLQKADADDLALATPLINIGKCHLALHNFEEARSHINRALAIRQKKLKPMHHLVTKARIALAQLEHEEGDTEASLNRINTLIKDIHGENAMDDFDKIAKPMHYFEALLQKGDAHLTLYEKTKNKQQLAHTLAVYEPALDLIDYIRTGLDEEDSKQVLLDENYAFYGKLISIYYELWQQTKDPQYAEKAFAVSEKGKSAVLLEAVKTTYAKNFAGIPAELLEKERQLKIDIAYTEKQRFEALEESELALKNDLSNQLFDLKLEYENLLKRFEKDFSAYYQLKYNTKNSSVQDVQKDLLDEKTTLLNYFLEDENLYIILLNKAEIQFVKHEIRDLSLQENIKEFINSIADYPEASLDKKPELEKLYIQHALSLHEFLIQPIQSFLKEKLIIIPHGLLGYVPFECLLQKQPENSFAFRSHDYLIKDFQMSYSYSANLLREMKHSKRPKAAKRFIGFAPSFSKMASDSRRVRLDGLGKLLMNGPEIDMIQGILQGDVYKDKEATEAAFTEKASDYQIIHLATHGIANDQSGDFCYLAFTEILDSIENEIMYVKELYPLRLNADMVVLSACETARGELKKGEGIVSLARGFSYAGAKSIITTLWSINDETTAQLMESFYQNLSKGKTKDAALRTAQLDFLSSNRDQAAHPVYWAAFIPVGNMQAIDLSRFGISSLALLSLGLLLGLLAFFVWRPKNKS